MSGVVSGVGYVTLNAGATSVGDVVINANVTAGAANGGTVGIDIDATNDVTIAGTLTTTDTVGVDIDIDAANEFTLTSGGFDSDDDVFITAVADDVNLGAGVTADGNVDIG